MQDLLKEYEATRKGLNAAYDERRTDAVTRNEEAMAECQLISEMRGEVEWVIDWLETGRWPGNKRGIERRAAINSVSSDFASCTNLSVICLELVYLSSGNLSLTDSFSSFVSFITYLLNNGGGDNVVARARDPNRDKAYEIWKPANGEIKLKDIADQLGNSEVIVRDS